MINSRAFLRRIGSPLRRTRAPIHTVLTSYSCKAYRQVPSFAARPRVAYHKKTRTEIYSNKVGQDVTVGNSTSAGFSSCSVAKMDPTPTTAGDTSSTAAGLPLTDEQIATHIPATLEDYSFPTDRLRTLNDTTKTPLVLMACGSC